MPDSGIVTVEAPGGSGATSPARLGACLTRPAVLPVEGAQPLVFIFTRSVVPTASVNWTQSTVLELGAV